MQYHSQPSEGISINLWKARSIKTKVSSQVMKVLWHGNCLMGNTNVSHPMGCFPWDSHRNDIPVDKPGYYSAYKLQDRKGYGLTKTSMISSVSYLNRWGWNFVWGFKLWILNLLWQSGISRAADMSLVPDIEGIQNKVICLWIGTTVQWM